MSAGTGTVESNLRSAAHRFGFDLSDTALQKLCAYIETLLFWRARISLTTAATADEIILQHIADSFALLPHVPLGSRLADIGSGAGFPGLPLAIARQDLHVNLIESRRKRANFLREVARQGRIENVDIVEGRVETVTPNFGGRFDVATSRALSAISDFLRLSSRLLRPGGIAIAMKGPKGRSEAGVHPGFHGPRVVDYPFNDSRHLLVIYVRE